ncbi:RES domain-containing protein [Clavibacter michiganensis]|nr:RES domain-containing protein [Clavibacter michiganensis]
MSRSDVAQKPPAIGQDLRRFPAALLTAKPRFRAHATSNGVWWFATSGDGRFDLTTPSGGDGTCYLADSIRAAVRERFGELVVDRQAVSRARADEFMVSAVMPPAGRYANVTATKADSHGITRELCTMTEYGATQAWSAAFHAAGFAGVRYSSRYTSAAGPNAWAMFGPAGESAPADRVVDGTPVPNIIRTTDGLNAARLAGIEVLPPIPASSTAVTWVASPPRP